MSLLEEKRPFSQSVFWFFLACVGHGASFMMLWGAMSYAPMSRGASFTGQYSARTLSLYQDAADRIQNLDTYVTNLASLSVSALQKASIAMQPVIHGAESLVQSGLHAYTALVEIPPAPTTVMLTPRLVTFRQIAALPRNKSAYAEVLSSSDSLRMNVVTYDAPFSILSPSGRAFLPAVIPPTFPGMFSISDSRKEDVTMTLPPANEIHPLFLIEDTTETQSIATTTKVNPIPDAAAAVSTNTGFPSRPSAKTVLAVQRFVEHIALPKDGRFGVIVVGSSVSDEYPETQQVWSGRLAYSAYLHVGLSKNWILQYSQFRSVNAAANGSVQHIEAPWPYEIFRPDQVSSELNADALMIHGILNRSGRLESLSIVYPAQFARASFILKTLQQWRFRPARQNGKDISVEIVLIIPNESR